MFEKFDKSKFETTTVDGISTVAYSDKDVYKNGTEIPSKVLKEVADYNASFAAGFTQVAKEVAQEHLVKEKGVNRVIVSTPYSMSARGSIDVTIDREKDFRNPVDGKVTKASSLTVRVTDPFVKVSKTKIRELKAELTATLVS